MPDVHNVTSIDDVPAALGLKLPPQALELRQQIVAHLTSGNLEAADTARLKFRGIAELATEAAPNADGWLGLMVAYALIQRDAGDTKAYRDGLLYASQLLSPEFNPEVTKLIDAEIASLEPSSAPAAASSDDQVS